MYTVWNRYQDEGWKRYKTTFNKVSAILLARRMARDAICYGMVRVTNEVGEIVTEYSAGELA